MKSTTSAAPLCHPRKQRASEWVGSDIGLDTPSALCHNHEICLAAVLCCQNSDTSHDSVSVSRTCIEFDFAGSLSCDPFLCPQTVLLRTSCSVTADTTVQCAQQCSSAGARVPSRFWARFWSSLLLGLLDCTTSRRWTKSPAHSMRFWLLMTTPRDLDTTHTSDRAKHYASEVVVSCLGSLPRDLLLYHQRVATWYLWTLEGQVWV